MATLPSLFISHGAPDLLLRGEKLQQPYRAMAAELPRPDAILIISAHWLTPGLRIGVSQHPVTHHDFGGFPAPLYEMTYNCPGQPRLAATIQERLAAQGIDVERDPERGLDHGAWVPLRLMYPAADIPVIPLSLPYDYTLDELIALGKALAPWRQEGVLIIGSGGSVHNLGALRHSGPADAWAQAFEAWLKETVEARDLDHLRHESNYPDSLPLAHPSLEHFLPLILAWAAGDAQRPGQRLSQQFDYANIGLAHYRFPAA